MGSADALAQAERDLDYRRAAVRRQAAMIASGLEPYSYQRRPLHPRFIAAARNLLWLQIQWANVAYRRLVAIKAGG